MMDFSFIDQQINKEIERVKKNFELFQKDLKHILDEESKRQNELAMREFSAIHAARVEELFKDSVTEWYDAYTPSKYRRRGNTSSGTGGLYEIFKTNVNADGDFDYDSVESLYNPNGMHKDRKGGDLYQKVFIQGWHGGGGWPPRYRLPYRKYYRWGSIAYKSEPADQIFRRSLDSVDDELFSIFKSISDSHQELAVQYAQSSVEQLTKKYFG